MNGRLLVLAVVAPLASTCFKTAPVVHEVDPERPPIILISLDTTRPDFLGCYGHPWVETPNLDRIAAEGILFEDAITPAPTTLAAHSSMLTGTYPHTHGVPRNGFYLDDGNDTVAEALGEAGYEGAAFIGGFPLNSRFNLDQGFDHYDNGMPRFWGKHKYQRSAKAVNASVFKFLDADPKNDPLFLFIHYFDPHSPYTPPKRLLRRYDRIERPQIKTPHELEDDMERLTEATSLKPIPDLVHRYAAEITYLDEELGKLFAGLAARNLFDTALIIVTSDHGEELWDHEPYFNHGQNVYHSTTRAVGIARLPKGAHGGQRIATPVSILDWTPSILGFLGLSAPAGVEGIDLRLKEGVSAPGGRVLFTEATKPHKPVAPEGEWVNALRTQSAYADGVKFIMNPLTRQRELYNVTTDPLEQDNVIYAPPPQLDNQAERLRKSIERWRAGAKTRQVAYPGGAADETEEALKSLGYLE